MNINENKEIENAEPSYIMRDSTYTEYTQKHTVLTFEYEYDDEVSIFHRITTATQVDSEPKSKASFWLGYIGATRLFYMAYPKDLDEAFVSVTKDYAWFRSQLTDIYKSENLEYQ